MKYFERDTGLIIEAVQWDESMACAAELQANGLILDNGYARQEGQKDRGVFMKNEHFVFIDQDRQTRCWTQELFNKTYAPITEERVRLVYDAQIPLLEQLSEKMHKGDEWAQESTVDLFEALAEEVRELEDELHEFVFLKSPDVTAARTKAAHVAICALMIMDKMNKIELGEMWKSKKVSC